MFWCRGLLGCAFVLGCASAEKPPVVVAAAPTAPATVAPPAVPSAPVTPPEAATEPERIDGPLWKSTAVAEADDSAPPPATATPSPPQGIAELGKDFEREFGGLEALQRAGESRCPGKPYTAQHDQCVRAEMERMVTELAPACAGKGGQAQHDCIIQEVFRKLGP